MATKRWIGQAQAVAQVDTVTIGGTIAQNDQVTLTINNKTLTVTVGTLVTAAQVATTVKEAWENETLTDTDASFTPANGGQDIIEFAEITATVSGAVVTLTHDTAGVPFTLVAAPTAGGDTTATRAAGTAATGPNFWNNAANWDTNPALPTSGDDVFIDNSDISILYGMAFEDTAPSNLNSLLIGANFTGEIGLPQLNVAGYVEYRNQYLQVGPASVTIGRGSGTGSGRIKIDTGTTETGSHDGSNNVATLNDSTASWTDDQFIGWTVNNTTDGSSTTATDNDATTVTGTLAGGTDDDWDTGDAYTIVPPACAFRVESTGSPAEVGLGSVLWKGDNEDNSLVVLDGSVEVAAIGGETAKLANVEVTSGTVRLREGVTFKENNTISNQEGTLEIYSHAYTVEQVGSGTTRIGGSPATGIDVLLSVKGGTVLYDSSGTIDEATVGGAGPATLEFSTNVSRTVTVLTVDVGATVRDDAFTKSVQPALAGDVRVITAS